MVKAGLVATSVAALLLTSACGNNKDSSGSDDSTPAPGKSDDVAIYVIGGKSDDPFWSRVKRGVDDAAKVVKAQGGKVTFLGPQNYDNLGPDAAKLIDSAVSQGATAVVGPDWVPEAQDCRVRAGRRQEHPAVDLQLRRHGRGRQARRDELHRQRRLGSRQGRWRVLR